MEKRNKKMKVVCLPYAGGSALMYGRWKNLFDDRIEIVQLELPGRGLRFKDESPSTMEELTEDMKIRLMKLVGDENYILLGFCYGAIVSYSIYEQLVREKSEHMPKGMILISSLPPGEHSKAERLFEMTNLKIVKTLLGIFSFNPFAASDDEMDVLKTMLEIVNPDVAKELRSMNLLQLILAFLFPKYRKAANCQTVLRIMRADGRVMYGYNGEKDSIPVRVPVIAIHGKKDNVVTSEHMYGWKQFCDGEFQLKEVNGGHLMLFDEDTDFVPVLRESIAELQEEWKERKIG